MLIDRPGSGFVRSMKLGSTERQDKAGQAGISEAYLVITILVWARNNDGN